MNNEKIKDIHERIYKFVVRVIKLTSELSKTTQNEVIIKQIVESSTSMGANDQEADGADTKKDFIAKYKIVRKENKETNYWLRLISEINPEFNKRMEFLIIEGGEILKIVSTIIRKTSLNIRLDRKN